MQTVNLNDIPSNILSMIPITVRLKANNGIIDFNVLTPEIQYLLLNDKDSEPEESLTYTETVYDLIPTMSVYNDLTAINNITEIVKQYFQNYIAISQGSYPFDPGHGNKIKYYLFNKDTFVAETLINEELSFIADMLSSMFELPITIKKKDLSKFNYAGNIMYNLELEVIINKKEPFTIQLGINE